jgi:hypothetical protein
VRAAAEKVLLKLKIYRKTTIREAAFDDDDDDNDDDDDDDDDDLSFAVSSSAGSDGNGDIDIESVVTAKEEYAMATEEQEEITKAETKAVFWLRLSVLLVITLLAVSVALTVCFYKSE